VNAQQLVKCRWFRNRTEIAKKTLSVVVGAHWIEEDEESQRRFQVRATLTRVYGISALRNTRNCTLLATARTAGGAGSLLRCGSNRLQANRARKGSQEKYCKWANGQRRRLWEL